MTLFVKTRISQIEKKVRKGETESRHLEVLGNLYTERAGRMTLLEKIHFYSQIASNMSGVSNLMKKSKNDEKARSYAAMAHSYYLKAYAQAMLAKDKIPASTDLPNPLSYMAAAIRACPDHPGAQYLAMDTLVPNYLAQANDAEVKGNLSVVRPNGDDLLLSGYERAARKADYDIQMHKKVNFLRDALSLYEQAAEIASLYAASDKHAASTHYACLQSAARVVRTLLKSDEFYHYITQSNLDHALQAKQGALDKQLLALDQAKFARAAAKSQPQPA